MIASTKVIVGLWKFKDSVPFSELKQYVENLSKDSNYEHLYIRGTSTDELGIGFTYHYDGSKASFDDWFKANRKLLMENFGHHCKGWDTSSACYLFKGFKNPEEE